MTTREDEFTEFQGFDQDPDQESDDETDDESEEEKEARLATDVDLDELSIEFVRQVVDKVLLVIDQVSGHPLYPYQRPAARRILESLIIGDGSVITCLYSRQCLAGDTVIFRRDGTAVCIKDHEHAWSTGVQPVKRIKMRGGAEILATDNHPVMTPDGWIPAGMLKVGDKVAVASEVSQWLNEDCIEVGRHKTPFSVSVTVNESVARLLGYMATNGSFVKGQSPKFTNTRDIYLDEFAGLIKELFDMEVKRYSKGRGWDLLVTTSKSLYDNEFLHFLRAVDGDHHFPKDVFSWPPHLAAEFINRAWSGDGCISMKKTGPDIFLATKDQVNARYWQALLLKFGISSMVKEEWMAKSTKPFYRLVIGSGAANVRRFFEHVGLIYGKEEQSQRAIDYFDAKLLLPSGKGRAERKMRPAQYTGPDGESIAYSSIVRIEDAGETETFDVEVPEKGWFIAQGVQVHNSGKSELIANTTAAAMILFPALADVYPDLMGKFKEGLWVGAYAPVEDQADNLFGRIASRLTSDAAAQLMQDPAITDVLYGKGKTITLKSGSLVRRQTCHPRAIIEGRTYHLILVDECQGADYRAINKSVVPQGAATNATMVFSGTSTYMKGVFYSQIQLNKRTASRKRARQNHFECDWREAGKYNPHYMKFVQREKLRLGEDSDEFKLSYCNQWLLSKGQFVSSEQLDILGDTSAKPVPAWFKSPVVVGIDPARKLDSTIVTVVWVDWDRPDEFGLYEHRILNWLDLTGVGWEDQYRRIVDFLSNYYVHSIGVDVGGVGDAVVARLRALMPSTDILDMMPDRPTQSDRWKHLAQLIDRRLIGWPAHPHTRRTKIWKRFRTQMEDLQQDYKGPYLVAAAPNETHAHDDFCDSLAIACALTKVSEMPQVEVAQNPFFSRKAEFGPRAYRKRSYL